MQPDSIDCIKQAFQCMRRGDQNTATLLIEMYLANKVVDANNVEQCGLLMAQLGKHKRAIDIFSQLIQGGHKSAKAHYNLGLLYAMTDDQPRALEQYELALKLQKDDPEILINHSAALNDIGLFDRALISAISALDVNNSYQEGWINKAIALTGLHRNQEALDSYQEVLHLNPLNAQARWNASLLQLLLGDYEAGFKNYEARWSKPNAEAYRHSTIPILDTFDQLNEKNILVWAEQGYGDTLQFCRYIENLKQCGANVVLECQSPLQGLLGSLNNCKVISIGDSIGPVDFQVPLLSLPGFFGTTLDNLAAAPPYLKAQQEKIEYWRGNLDLETTKLNIGISCSGNLDNRKLIQRATSLRNFLPFLDFAKLFLIQKDLRAEDLEILKANPNIVYLGDQIVDFDDSAAIVDCMDLIVSIDTSLVHLTGALGKETWVCLHNYPDWRWGESSTQTPWYPMAKLFRQKNLGDWTSVFEEMTRELRIRVIKQ